MTVDTNMQALNIIRDAYDRLMSRQFFFYNIASQFALKSVTKDQCPTMGVGHIDGVYWLVYNPDFIKYYDFNEISVILEHEICHFTFDHVRHFDSSNNVRKIFKTEEEVTDSIRDAEKEKLLARLRNIATDRSINIHLFGLPNIRMSLADIKADYTNKEGILDQAKMDEYTTKAFANKDLWFKDQSMTIELADDSTILEANCITEESFKKILVEAQYAGDITKVTKYGTWEYYFDLLMSCPKTEEAIKNIKDMDIHFGDEDGEGEGGRNGQEARDKVMMEAARNSNKHDIPGNLRDHLKSLFDKYSKETALPWNVILRRMVNASKKSEKKNDVNSRNKYAPGSQILPGYRLDPIKDVAVVWDVSGSCMDEETQTTFIKEVNAMIKAGSNVRVYYTDQDVEHIQDCKGKPMRPAEYQITGGGGTHLDNGLKKAIEDGYRILIQVSDNYMSFDLSKKDLKGRKVINVSTTEAKQPQHYGPQIHINRK
jgi:predicted metal-dependent peptidase